MWIRCTIERVNLWHSDDDAVGELTHSVDRLLRKARRLHIRDETLAKLDHCRWRTLGVADRDRHIVVTAGQNARAGQRRLRLREHRHHVAEGVGLARRNQIGRGLGGLDRHTEHGALAMIFSRCSPCALRAGTTMRTPARSISEILSMVEDAGTRKVVRNPISTGPKSKAAERSFVIPMKVTSI